MPSLASHPTRAARIALALVAWATLLAAGRADAQYYAPPPEGYYTDDRVRFTIEGHLGGAIGSVPALAGGTTISIGLQMNDIIATYASHRLVLAGGLDGGALFAAAHNAAVLEVTVFDWFQIGAGPSLDFGIGGLCEANALACEGVSDVHLGLEVRLALVLGARTPARRHGTSISLVLHPTWVDRNTVATSALLGIGYASF